MEKKEFQSGGYDGARRVWLGLFRVNQKLNCSRLIWADKKMAFKYSPASKLYIWESPEPNWTLRFEAKFVATYDSSKKWIWHYALYADGDIGRLPSKGIIYISCGILFPKLLVPTVRKNCSNDRDCFLKFKTEGQNC